MDPDTTPPADPTTPPPAWIQQLEHQQHILSQQGASITTLGGLVEAQLKMITQLQNDLQQLRDDFTAAVAARSNLTERMGIVEMHLEHLKDRRENPEGESPATFDTGLADRTKDAVLHLAQVLSKPDSPGHPRQNLFSQCARIITGVPTQEALPGTPLEAGCEPAPEA